MKSEPLGNVRHGDVLLACGCRMHRMTHDFGDYAAGKIMQPCAEHVSYNGQVMKFHALELVIRLPKK